MGRYVNLDEKVTAEFYDEEHEERFVKETTVEGVLSICDSYTEVDAEPIIRCKDCKWHIEAHYEADGEPPYIKHKCKWFHGYQFSLDHYCGMAERKTYDQTVVTNEQEMILLCKYCKYWSPFGDGSVGYCHLNAEIYTEKSDGYCSHAKRKEE